MIVIHKTDLVNNPSEKTLINIYFFFLKNGKKYINNEEKKRQNNTQHQWQLNESIYIVVKR